MRNRDLLRYVVEKGYALLPKPFTMEQLSRKVREVLEATRKPIPKND